MKTIKINENQLKKLFEINTTLGTDNPSDVKEYQGSQVSATVPVKDTNGDTTYGKPKTTDKVSDDLVNQNYFWSGHRKSF